jgi:multidrug efflux pump subunit AcrB
VLEQCVGSRRIFAAAFLLVCLASLGLIRPVGEDFFPSVDSGQFKLHLRAPTGMRIEETAALCDRVEAAIREIIPREEIASVIDNIGLPYSSINLSYTNSAPIGSSDADILVGLTADHRSTEKYLHDLRLMLQQKFPGVLFSFIPADIVTQILNFGLPAPIDVQVVGKSLEVNRQFAANLADRLRRVPGMVDLHVHQAFNQPLLHLDVDRAHAAETGFTQRDLAFRQRTDDADVLAQSGQRGELFGGDADAAVRARLTPAARQHPGDGRSQLSATGARGARRRFAPGASGRHLAL